MNTQKINRIGSIDLLRGLIMIIMALDHTRDYFHADAFVFDPLNLSKTSVVLFFTRWITHFCAPIFILLAGTSAFISGQRKTKKELSIFLVKRGLWLIFLELTVVNFAWLFNLHFSYLMLAVIWTLGICMIFLAALLFLPKKVILCVGLILVCAHNLMDAVHFPDNNFIGVIWGLLHDRKLVFLGHEPLLIAYPILPWIGTMALGYCLGGLYANGYDPEKRKKILLRLGVGSLLLFIVLRTITGYGNIMPWSSQPTALYSFLSFINISKYPPSLDYLLVTEAFAFIFLALTENISNRFTKFISVYGRVPLFYYLLHIFLIHLIALFAVTISGRPWTDMTSLTSWVTNSPSLKGYGFSLGTVYLIWIFVVLALYPLCKKYDRYKSAHKGKWWLSYL